MIARALRLERHAPQWLDRIGASFLAPALIALGYAALAWTMTWFAGRSERVEVVWLPNAILVSVLLWRRLENTLQIAVLCVAAKTAKNLLIGDPLTVAAGYAVPSVLEAVITAHAIFRLCGGPPRWHELQQLARFSLAAAFLGPIVSGTIAAALLAPAGSSFDMRMWSGWFTTSALGMVIGTPVFTILLEAVAGISPYRRHTPGRWLLVMLPAAAVTLAIFLQSSYPLLFIACPVVLVAAFRLGPVGAAAVTLLVALIAATATSYGYGPVNLVNGELHVRVLVLEGFLLTIFASTLPVTAALVARQQLADQLAEARDFAQSTLDEIRDVIFRTDAEGRWTFLNPAWERITGTRVRDALGRRCFDWRATGRPKRALAQLLLGQRDEAAFDQCFRRADRSYREAEVHVRALRSADGKLIGTIGSIRDVTETRASERALAENELRMKTLAELSPAGVLRTCARGGVTFANPAWQRLSGLTPQEAMGSGWTRALHPQDAERVSAEWHDAIADGRSFSGEYRFVRPDGSTRWVTANAAPEIGEQGEVVGYVGVLLDISHRKAMERDLEFARQSAEDAALAKSRFLANMSHEIRTPMNGVLGFTDLLLAGDLTAEQREQAELIASSGKAMMRLLNDILDLSKVEAGQMSVANEPIALAHTLKQAVRLFEPVAASKGVALELDVAPGLPERVVGDGMRIRQIVANLVGNAVKFTARGAVTVSVGASGGQLAITVKDTGPGIPPDRQEAVFGEFEQADRLIAQSHGGSGLGLAISRKLARLIGGEVKLESIVGLGSIFRLTLPLVPAPRDARSVEPEAREAAAPARDPAHPPRVLVAEDHDINQRLVLALLERLGAEATLVADGEQAIAEVERSRRDGDPYDLVLMDVQMPRLDGIEAARRIRNSGIGAQALPIVALTANAYAEDVEACLRVGMQSHIAKPVQIEALSQALRRWATAQPQDAQCAAGAGTDPIYAALRPKFDSLCAECAEAAARVRAGLPAPDGCDLTALTERCHRLAGTAQLFGMGALGTTARRVERRAAKVGRPEALNKLLESFERMLPVPAREPQRAAG